LFALRDLAAPLCLGWAAAFAFTALSIRIAKRTGIVSHPNARTSHEGAVPRIGGIGIVIPYLLAIVILLIGMAVLGKNTGPDSPFWALRVINPGFLWASLLGGAGAFAFGLWDDMKGMNPVVKLFMQIVIAVIPVCFGLGVANFSRPGLGIIGLSGWSAGVLGFCWVLFWMNAYNFMDGINGIAGRFGEIVGLSFFLVAIVGAGAGDRMLLALLVGACAGFLKWNAPNAKTFMGDCGSQFLGFIFALWTLHLPEETMRIWILAPPQGAPPRPELAVPFLALVLIMLPFAWDVVWTLIRRARRGENLFQAHRSHLYQRLLATGLTHEQTLAVCEWTFRVCALAGLVLAGGVRYPALRAPAIQWGCVIAAAGTMIIYSLYVIQKERISQAKSGE